MAWTDEQLDAIFERTDGRCHICRRGLKRGHYGRLAVGTGWEVEHSNPRAKGGTDRLSNLYAAHISCNRSKGAASTQTARAQHGYTCAPMSAAKQEEARLANAAAGGLLGLVGAGMLARAAAGAAFGPGGVLVCVLTGILLGYDADPEA